MSIEKVVKLVRNALEDGPKGYDEIRQFADEQTDDNDPLSIADTGVGLGVLVGRGQVVFRLGYGYTLTECLCRDLSDAYSRAMELRILKVLLEGEILDFPEIQSRLQSDSESGIALSLGWLCGVKLVRYVSGEGWTVNK